MDYLDILTILGFVISVGSTVVAIVQTVRKRDVERAMAELRRARRVDTWTSIAVVTKTFETLSDAREALLSRSTKPSYVLSKVSSARRGTIDQWRYLIKQAVLDEPTFNESTLERWISEGKLENEWRIAQVRRLLDNSQRDIDD